MAMVGLICKSSLEIISENSHGAKWPYGSMETIFFASSHCGKGPIIAAGSLFVKSGLYSTSAEIEEMAQSASERNVSQKQGAWRPCRKLRI